MCLDTFTDLYNEHHFCSVQIHYCDTLDSTELKNCIDYNIKNTNKIEAANWGITINTNEFDKDNELFFLNINDHTKYTFIETLKLIRKFHLQNPKIINLLDDLISNKKTPLYNTIIYDNYGGQINWKNEEYVSNTDFNKAPNILLTTNFGISSLIRLYGKIIVPIPDDKWITKLKNSPGVATILDGGLVTVNDFKSEIYYSEADLFGFVKVSDISTELI